MGDADTDGSLEGVAEDAAEAAGVGLGDDVVGDGDGVDGVGLGALAPGDDGEPTGVVVHPARTPAQTKALRAATVRVTTSG